MNELQMLVRQKPPFTTTLTVVTAMLYSVVKLQRGYCNALQCGKVTVWQLHCFLQCTLADKLLQVG